MEEQTTEAIAIRSAFRIMEVERRTEIARTEDPQWAMERTELAAVLRATLETLPPRHERVIRMYYGFGIDRAWSLEEIAFAFDVTRERIRQMHDRAMRMLQKRWQTRRLLRDFIETPSVRRARPLPMDAIDIAPTPKIPAKDRISWPDLSAYGVELRIYVLPTGKRALIARTDATVPDQQLSEVFRDAKHRCDRIERQLKDCGFERLPSAMWVRRDCTIPFESIRRHLPSSRVRPANWNALVHFVERENSSGTG